MLLKQKKWGIFHIFGGLNFLYFPNFFIKLIGNDLICPEMQRFFLFLCVFFSTLFFSILKASPCDNFPEGQYLTSVSSEFYIYSGQMLLFSELNILSTFL